jgi:hypothetical protein
MQLNWNGLRVPKCLIILKKFLPTLLLRNGKREFKIILLLGDRTMDRFTQVIEEYILEYVDPLLRTTWSVFEELSSSCTHPNREIMQREWKRSFVMNRLPRYRTGYFSATNKEYDIRIISSDMEQSWIRAGKSLVTNTLAESSIHGEWAIICDEKIKTRKRDSSGNKKRIFTVPAAVVISTRPRSRRQ